MASGDAGEVLSAAPPGAGGGGGGLPGGRGGAEVPADILSREGRALYNIIQAVASKVEGATQASEYARDGFDQLRREVASGTRGAWASKTGVDALATQVSGLVTANNRTWQEMQNLRTDFNRRTQALEEANSSFRARFDQLEEQNRSLASRTAAEFIRLTIDDKRQSERLSTIEGVAVATGHRPPMPASTNLNPMAPSPVHSNPHNIRPPLPSLSQIADWEESTQRTVLAEVQRRAEHGDAFMKRVAEAGLGIVVETKRHNMKLVAAVVGALTAGGVISALIQWLVTRG